MPDLPSNALPPCVDLKVPYLSQLDNRLNPYGACNVTSLAMVLKFFGIKGNGDGQLEDQLNRRMVKLGLDRHNAAHLAYLVNLDYAKYGISDTFTMTATHAQVKAHLAKGFPVVVHSWLTNEGHIIVIRGYDDKAYGGRGAYIVNDPYGEYFANGYDTSASGERQLYSYKLTEKAIGTDGDFFVHFFNKETTK